MEKLLDVDRFISYVVCEMITVDWDGYPSKCNNYRIYHDPKTNKITFIPSGMDQDVLSTPTGRSRPTGAVRWLASC